jgi:anti-sigma factor RsiW
LLRVEILRMIKRRVLHRLAQVNLSPEDGQRLSERLESDASLSAEERDHMIAVVRAMQACQQLLAPPISAALPASKRRAKRKRQEAKAARRRHRR